MDSRRHRRSTLLGLLLTVAAVRALGNPGPGEPLGTIAVALEGIRTRDGGVLAVMLFRGGTGWLDPDSAFARVTVPVSADTARVLFQEVPFDTAYAIEVFHDRNGNGRMDMRWLPYPRPKEGAGVSNNAVRRGPPEFGKARFAVSDSLLTLRIFMRY
jgi:uncharacterized protein (DUF2141 family)